MSLHMKTDAAGSPYLAVSRRGTDLILDAFTNKGSAFPPDERGALGLTGLLPPAVNTMEQQLARTYENYRAHSTDLARHEYLSGLHDRNETLFFRLVLDHIDEMMPVVYTPTVGEACQRYSHIFRRARGLYIGIDQQDRIPEVLANSPIPDPSVIVVTDGERILGLGDQGAGGIGICVGKLNLYTLCAGIAPYGALPILLDAGTENEERLADPLYLGLRRHRARGEEYQEFVDRFVEAVQARWPGVLLQWEDFLKENAIRQLDRFRDRLCTFNDDIQGTGAVALAGVYASLRITRQRLADQRFVFAGAGASTHGIAGLLVAALVEEGLSEAEARRRIWTVDSQGLVVAGRTGLETFKIRFARSAAEASTYACRDRARITLEETLLNARPTVLIGSSAKTGLFNEAIVRKMAELNERPCIFALSNPTSKCEVFPADAIRWTGGRVLIATGSPFAPVAWEGRVHRIGQCNNSFVFPGVGLGVTAGRVRRVTDEMFLDAAKALAECVTDVDLEQSALYPTLSRIREVSHAVACSVIRRAVGQGHAEKGMLQRLDDRVRAAMWKPEYLPLRYEAVETR